MDEVAVTALGAIATMLAALSLLPQVIRTWRTFGRRYFRHPVSRGPALDGDVERVWWPHRRPCHSLGQPHYQPAGCNHSEREAHQRAQDFCRGRSRPVGRTPGSVVP